MRKLFVFLLGVALLLVGCGGGGGGKGSAAPSISVDWPTRTRNFSAPSSALSVTFLFQNSALTRTYATVNANRSSTLTAHTETYVSATKIPLGSYTVSATFYSLANQAGIVVATATAPVQLSSNGSLLNPSGTPLGQIAFEGVVNSVALTANQSLTAGNTQQLVVTAYNAQSNALALTPGSFKFNVTGGSQYLSVTPDGIASGFAAGNATVTATVDNVTSPAATVTVLPGPAAPSISVDWPTRTRSFDAPSSGLSVSFLVQNAAGTQTFATINGNRSSKLTAHTETYVSSSTIPLGTYTVNGTFYSQANQGGIVVATVSIPVLVSAGGTLEQPNGSPLGQVAFVGVVKSVALAAGQTVSVGATQQLTVTAYDGAGNALALTPGSFKFSVTAGSSLLSVTPDGIGTGIAAGQASVKATVDNVTSPVATVTVPFQPVAPSIPVDWPVRTRNFSAPNSGLSVSFLFQNQAGTQTFATVTGNRSSTLTAHTETYTSSTTVPVGTYTVNGSFYSQANQAGIVVATVTVPVSVSPSGTLTKPDGSPLGEVAFTGVVKSVKISANQTVSVGATQQLAVTAYDADSNAVALTPGSFSFSVTSGSKFLTVTPDGIATGVAVGSSSVHASVDGVTSPAASVAAVNGFTNVFRFTQQTDTIALTGGSLNGACPLGNQFTIEVVIRPTTTSGLIWQQWTDTYMNELLTLDAGNFKVLGTGSFQPNWWFTGAGVTINGWNHLAWCYDGTDIYLYQNGVLTLTSAAPNGFDPIVAATNVCIGENFVEDGTFSGDLAAMRISNVVRYTGSTYTPPTGPFTLDSSTLLLINPSSFSSAPTSFSAPGTQGITATLGAGFSAATSATWVAYTP